MDVTQLQEDERFYLFLSELGYGPGLRIQVQKKVPTFDKLQSELE